MKGYIYKWMVRFLCLTLALGTAVSSCTVYAVSRETQSEIDRLKEEKSKAEAEKKAAEREKGSISSQKSAMESYLKELEKQAGSLSEQIRVLEKEIAEKEAAVQIKEEEVQAAEEVVSRQYEDMKKRIQYMYENGQGNVLNYMASALTGDLADALNQAEYAITINRYDREMLADYKEAKADLEQQKEELLGEQEALALMKEETEKKKQQVASQQNAAGSKISQFDELLDQVSGEVSSMEELIAEKTKILNQLIKKAEEEERQARIAAAQQAAASMGGGSITAGDSQISHHAVGLSDYELMLLATMIYCEAGNQGWEGQTAVGYVIMNRVRSSLYPNSLEAVLRQSKQFEPAGSGRFDLVLKAEQDPDIPNIVTESCWNAAKAVINGTSNVGDSLFFRTWAPVPSLIENLKSGGVPYWIIKDHIFYYYWTSYTTGQKPSQKPEEEEPDDEEPDDAEEPEDDGEPDDTEEPDDEEPDDGEETNGPDGPDDGEDTRGPDSPDDEEEPDISESPASPDDSDAPDGGDSSEEAGADEGMRE